MHWDVKTVKPLSDYRIYVETVGGQRGIFDLKPFLDHGIFRELKDPDYFNQVSIVPNNRVETPLSPELPTPLNAFSISSTMSTQGAMASAMRKA